MSPDPGGGPPAQRIVDAAAAQAALAAAVALALFLPAVRFPFVSDDLFLIVQNPWIRGVEHLGSAFTSGLWAFPSDERFGTNYYRPFAHLAFTLLYALAGPAPWAYHLLNVVLHAINAALVVLLGRQLQAAFFPNRLPWLAITAGLLFAVHPIHVEAAAWASGVFDLGTTAFGLSSLLLWRRGRRFASAGCLFAALAFKEVAAAVPVLALLWLWASSERRAPRAGVASLWPMAAATALYLGLRTFALRDAPFTRQHASLSFFEVLLNAPVLLAQGLRMLVWPAPLNVFHVFRPVHGATEWPFVLAVIFLASAALLFVVVRRSNRGLALPLAWCVAPILPTLYVPALGENAFAERYLYLPSVGFCLAAGIALGLALERGRLVRAAGAAALLAAVVFSGAATAHRLPAWSSARELWSRSVAVEPDSPVAHYNLGHALLDERKPQEAIEHFQAALALRPDYFRARNNLAIAHAQVGDFERAERELRRLVELSPRHAGAHHNLGLALRRLQRDDEAILFFRRALALDPKAFDSKLNLVALLERKGQREEAAALARQLVDERPDSKEAAAFLRRLVPPPAP